MSRPAARPGGRRLRRGFAVVVLAVLVAIAGALAWAVGSSSGLSALAALAQRASGGALRLGAVDGRLLGPIRVDEFELILPALRLQGRDLTLEWSAAALFARRLQIERLAAGELRFAARASDPERAETPSLPESLRLPLELALDALELDVLARHAWLEGRLGGEELRVEAITAAVRADAEGLRVERAVAELPWGRAELQAALGASRPFPLSLRGSLAGRFEAHDYRLVVDGSGNLPQPQLRLALDSEGAQAQVDAVLRPLEPVPLERLRVAVAALDPSRLAPGAPRAELALEAELLAEPDGGPAPLDWRLSGPLRLVNASPGRWDAGALPLRELSAHLRWADRGLLAEALEMLFPGAGTVRGEGRWRWLADDPLGAFAARLEVAGLDPREFDGRLPAAQLGGTLYAGGDAAVQHLALELADAALSLSLDARKAAERIELARLALRHGGARIEGRGEALLAGEQPFSAQLSLHELDPQALFAGAPRARLNAEVRVEGRSAPELQAAAQLRLRPSRLFGQPLQGEGSLDFVAGRAADAKLTLRLADSRIALDARLGLGEGRPLTAALALGELDPSRFGEGLPQARVNAVLDLSGRLDPAPSGAASFRLGASSLLGRPLAGEGRLTLSPGRLSGAELWLALAGNRLEARGGWGGEGDVLELSIEAGSLGVIAQGLRGNASVRARLAGTPAEPAGELLLTASGLVLPGGLRVQGLNLQGELQRGLDGPLVLAAGVGEISGADRVPLIERIGVAIDGRRSAHRAEIELAGAGGDALRASLAGSLGEDLGWRGTLEALESEGRLALSLSAPAALEFGPERVTLGAARLAAGAGSIELGRTQWSPAGLQTVGRASGIAFGLAHDPHGRTRRSGGELRLGGEWELLVGEQINGLVRVVREAGDLVLVGDAPARLGLEVFEATLSATDGNLAFSAHAEGSRLGRFSASASALAERDGAGLRLAPDAPLLGSARLDMPSIRWLGPLLNASLGSDGALKADFTLSGTARRPVTAGALSGRDLDITLADAGLRLSGGTLEAGFDQDYLRIIRLEFLSPSRVTPRESRIAAARLMAEPGHFLASGGIDLASGVGRFGFYADRLPLLQRVDRWLVLSGEGSIDSSWDSIELRAQLEADAGAITIGDAPPPSLSDDVVILGQEKPPSRFKVSADLGIRLGRNFYLTAMGLDTRLAGGLDVVLRPDRPAATTGVIALEDGVFEGYGQKLAVASSTVNFAGPPDNPALNIVALRKGLEVEAGVSITGTARRPRVQLVSFPTVPDAEKLAWIVLGRPPDTTSGADLGLLIPAAQALLGGPGGGFTEQLSNSLGLDQISIGQGDLNSVGRGASSSVVDSGVRNVSQGSVAGDVVTLGKRLSVDTFLAFEQSLVGAESIVKLTHQLGRRVSVVARGGTDNAIDLFYSVGFR